MYRLIVLLVGLIAAVPAWAVCPTTPADCPSGAANNWTVANALSVTGASTLSGGGTLTGIFNGGTFSGITLSGTIAGTPIFSGTVTTTGNLNANGNVNVGTSTTAKLLTLAAPAGGSGQLIFSYAGVIRHQLLSDSGTNLQFRASDTGGLNPVTWLSVTPTTGLPTFKTATTFAAPVSFAPGNIAVSGSSAGTAGVDQPLNITSTISGTTTALTPFIANDVNLLFNGVAPGSYTGWRFLVKSGGASLNNGGGTTGVELDLNMAGDVPTIQTGIGTYTAFAPKSVITSSNSASIQSVETLNPVCLIKTTTNFNTLLCEEFDYAIQADATAPDSGGAIGISNNHFNAQQGQLNDSAIRFWSSPRDAGAHPVGWRDLLTVGGTAGFPLNPTNGAILDVAWQTAANSDSSAMLANSGVFGFNLSNYVASGAQMRWAGGKISGGEFDANFLRLTQGSAGPVIDAGNQCAASGGLTWVSGTGFVAGEQISDRIGGNLVIDTVDVVTGKPLTWHWGQSSGVEAQPCIAPGEVRVVARGWTAGATASGSTILNIGKEPGFAVGDTVVAPTTSGVIAGGTKILSFNAGATLTTTAPNSGATLTFASTAGAVDGGYISGGNVPPQAVIASHTATTIVLSIVPSGTVASGVPIQIYRTANLSAATTGILAALTPIYSTLTGIPSNPIVLFGGSGTSATFNYTWTTPTTLQIGATVNTLIGTGSALATNATSGFLQLATMAGAPTGTVGAAGKAAVVIDTTNKKICYSTGGGTWECSVAFTP